MRLSPAALIAAAALPCSAQWLVPTGEYRELYTYAWAYNGVDGDEWVSGQFPDFPFALFDVSDDYTVSVPDAEARVGGSQRSLVGPGGLLMQGDLFMETLVNTTGTASAQVSAYSEWRLEFEVPAPSYARLIADTNSGEATLYDLDLGEYLVDTSSDATVELEPGVRYEFYGLVSNGISDNGAGSLLEASNSIRASFSVAPRDVPCGGDFAYPTFFNATGLTTLGAAYESVWMNLTDAGDQRGAVWHTASRVHARDGFDSVFQFRIPASDFVDGDGFAFVIQSESPVAIGGGGSGLGYASDNQPGITRSLAVEFDTFFFSGFEFDADHISVQTDGVFENQSNDSFSRASTVLPVDINQGQTHTARVLYTPAQGSTPSLLRIFLNDLANPLITLEIDLDDINGESILDADGCTYAGFTAGTGLANSNHQILSWNMVDQPATCPADLAPPAGTLNFFDIAAFLTAFNTNDPAADFAAPFGTFNFFDVAAFLAAYNAGCP